MPEKLYDQFKNPDNTLRGKPFWAWNGKLEKEELLRQIQVMKEMGFGGFFMHSRVGLETEYLGEEWFKLIEACTEKAVELDMEPWLYDEDRWPSGTAGGKVTEKPEYRMKFLRLLKKEDDSADEDLYEIARFKAEYSDLNLKNYSSTEHDNWDLKFVVSEAKRDSFYNGNTFVNTLSKEATDYFIKITHGKYKEKIPEKLFSSIKGIFTDEPHRGPLMSSFGGHLKNPEWGVPWCDDLADEYKKRFSDDILERLPELFFNMKGEKVSKIKWQFVELLQQLFLERFIVPVNEWCKKNNFILTGHVLQEDNLTGQTIMSGSVMRAYEHMEYPGIDVLGQFNKNFWLAKQLSSVARQTGKKWMLSELYGCTGWHMDFQGHKEVGDWQALFGVNLRCPHISWYTMKGQAKRDYPASILHQSGWWKDYNKVENYFARLSLILMQGDPECSVLVINPIESVWAQIHPGWNQGLRPGNEDIEALEKSYTKTFNLLMENKIDFDYGDENHIKEYGRVLNGNETFLNLNNSSYKYVIVSGLTTIRSSTLSVLENFQNKGGKIFLMGTPPEYCDALKSDRAIKLFEKTEKLNKENIHSILNRQKLIRVSDAKGKIIKDIYLQIRKTEDRHFFVLLNTNREKIFRNVKIQLYISGFLNEWQIRTGDVYKLSNDSKEIHEIALDFHPGQEHIFSVDKFDSQLKESKKNFILPRKDEQKEILLQQTDFEYELKDLNVLVLDYASHKINDGEWSKEKEILKTDIAIRDFFKIARRSGQMLQPWFVSKKEIKKLGKVFIKFNFNVTHKPEGPLWLALENSENLKVELNGNKINLDKEKEHWIDICFFKVPVNPDFIKIGVNQIILEMDFHKRTDIESIYLLGNFAVNIENEKPVLGRLPEKMKLNNLIYQGLAFYSSEISFTLDLEESGLQDDFKKLNDGERVFIIFEDFTGGLIKISNSSGKSRAIMFKPYTADIAEILDGNKLTISLILTRKNTFGPLHQNNLYPRTTGPRSFITEAEAFTDNYQLVPSGITGDIKFLIKSN